MLFRYNTKYKRFEVLLGKRACGKGYGKWAILGGRMETIDNDYWECALREFWEESGVGIWNLQSKKLAVKKTDCPFFLWRTYMILTWGYFPEFEINYREHSELRWFPVSTVCKQNLWINLNHEIRAFRRFVRKHALVVAYHTGMPLIEDNLLDAYRLLTHMKFKRPQEVELYLLRHMDISIKEARKLSRKLKKYYKEDAT